MIYNRCCHIKVLIFRSPTFVNIRVHSWSKTLRDFHAKRSAKELILTTDGNE